MTSYPVKVKPLRPRFDPDRHPPLSPLRKSRDREEPERGAGRQADSDRRPEQRKRRG